MSEPLTDDELAEIETLARHQRLVRPIAGVVLRLVEEVRRLRAANAEWKSQWDSQQQLRDGTAFCWQAPPAPDHVIEVKE